MGDRPRVSGYDDEPIVILEGVGLGPLFEFDHQVCRFAIVTDSPAIARRYEAAMQPGVDLPIWKKNQRAHWEVEKVIPVPAWLIERVDFQLIGDH